MSRNAAILVLCITLVVFITHFWQDALVIASVRQSALHGTLSTAELRDVEGTGQPYTYPDFDSRLICWFNAYTSRVYGAVDPEMQLWMRAQAFLERVGDGQCDHIRYYSFEAGGGIGRMVDVGCGRGRIVLRFGPLFQTVDCIEPDAKRRSMAKDELSKPHESWSRGRVSYYGSRFLDWDAAGKADVLTIMHIVQHIPSHELSRFLLKIQRTLAPGGILVLATTVSLRNESYFTISDGKIINKEVAEAEFNHYAETSRVNNASGKPVLAVRFFDAKELQQLVGYAGLTILESERYMYHRLNGEPIHQYIIATPTVHDDLWPRDCGPVESLQLPRMARYHLVENQATVRIRHDPECYQKWKEWTLQSQMNTSE